MVFPVSHILRLVLAVLAAAWDQDWGGTSKRLQELAVILTQETMGTELAGDNLRGHSV